MTEPEGEDRRMTGDYKLILERFLEEPGGHVLLDHEYKVVDCGPEFLRLTKARRENVVGKYVFDTLTEPDPERQAHATGVLRAALQRAGETMEVEKTAEFRCDVREQAPGARSEERWWRAAIVPLHRDGRVDYYVIRVEDITLPVVTHNALDAQRKSNYVLYVLVCGIVGFVIYFFSHANHEIKKNTAKVNRVSSLSCQIQSQSLPAQHYLASVMADINHLLLAPQSKSAPKPTHRVIAIVGQMEVDLNHYLSITKSLPQSRAC